MTDPKAHLGVAVGFPLCPVGGRLHYASHEDAIEQSIRLILGTSPGERLMLPAFGAGLRDFAFEPSSAATHDRIAATVRRALVEYEARITVERVEVTASADAPELAWIDIDYVVLATNNFYNRVFPFYLLEGRA